jgi:vancomycin resistance protein YoaR
MKKAIKKIFASVVLIILIVAAATAFLISLINVSFKDRVLPRVYLGDDSLAGLDYRSLERQINQKIVSFNPRLILTFEGKSWTVDSQAIGLEFDGKATSQRVFSIGRDKSMLKSFLQQIGLIAHPVRVKAVYSLSQKKLAEAVAGIASEIDKPEKDASLMVKDGKVIEVPQSIGRQLDQEKVKQEIISRLDQIEDVVLPLKVRILKPKVYQEGLSQAKAKLRRLIAKNLYLKTPEERFELTQDQISQWFDLYATSLPVSSSQGGAVDQGRGFYLGVSLDRDRIKTYLITLAQEIDREPINAKLTIRGGKATVFRPSEPGLKLNQEKTLELIEQALTGRIGPEIDLPIETKEPKISNQKVNKLGIHQLIGRATTSFKGSPKNRVHNIKNGVEALTGILIEPNEVFSVVAKLGEVDSKTGYLPELVIKQNRTVPEYGGGLCQVSTTLFRSALDAGLPIIERQNHSYRVSYYEPPIGLDATVYLPRPDLKFKNDTPGYILIQGEVRGNNLTFELYGTSDGRTVKIKGPYTSGYTDPPDPIYIETDSLARGEIKQVERAHKGATSIVYYRVFNQDKTERHSQTFKSKYKAWAAQFLVGTAEPEGGEGQDNEGSE